MIGCRLWLCETEAMPEASSSIRKPQDAPITKPELTNGPSPGSKMEAAGIEPASAEDPLNAATCVVRV